MRVLVTGATGFIGAWSAKATVDAATTYDCSCATPRRSGSTVGARRVGDPEIATSDITDESSVAISPPRTLRVSSQASDRDDSSWAAGTPTCPA